MKLKLTFANDITPKLSGYKTQLHIDDVDNDFCITLFFPNGRVKGGETVIAGYILLTEDAYEYLYDGSSVSIREGQKQIAYGNIFLKQCPFCHTRMEIAGPTRDGVATLSCYNWLLGE